jgi:hypothetical protein
MRTVLKFASVAALSLAALSPPTLAGDTVPSPKSGERRPVEWARSFGDAVREATERNLPILLHSHATGCPPCTAIRREVFEDADYVKWANAESVHVLSYYLHEEDREKEVVERERDGEKVAVFAAHPAFTPDEMEVLRGGIDVKVAVPEKTPWAGVLSSDGTKVLAEKRGKARGSELRDLYAAEAKKMGPSLARPDWLRANRALSESTVAEVDERWKEAVAAVLPLLGVAKGWPRPLARRVLGQVESLDAVRARLLEAAAKAKDPAARSREEAAVAEEFRALPAPASLGIPSD